MADNVDEEEVRYLTPKQIAAGIVVVGALTNAGNIADLVYEGDPLDHEMLELQIEQIIDDDVECRRRQEAIESDLAWLREKVLTYQSTTKQRDEYQDQLIQQFMRRPQ